MKRLGLCLPLVLICFAAGCDRLLPPPGPLPPIEICFSPHGGCTEAVVSEIDHARTSILVQAYSFTSVPIAKALVDAHHRGVQVHAILDHSQRSEKYTEADFLVHAGIPTLIDAKHAIAHNKVMVIDGQVVLTGSFNFTKAAEESNAENLLIIRDEAIAAKYTANWQQHAAHSEPYGGRQAEEDHKSPARKSHPSHERKHGEGDFSNRARNTDWPC
jgi:phosphatidylserine/phosphatidylglycerophosphate/cardiolipin synthase-like enzyme